MYKNTTNTKSQELVRAWQVRARQVVEKNLNINEHEHCLALIPHLHTK